MSRKAIKYLAVALGIMALVLGIHAHRSGHLQPKPYLEKGCLVPVTDQTPWGPNVIPVTIGIFVENIYDFSVETLRFSGEGWVWVIWPQEFEDILQRTGQPIERAIDFVNSVELWDSSTKACNEKPLRLPDGRFYQVIKFSQKFQADDLDFRRFPFETLSFPISLSFSPEILPMNSAHVRLVPDLGQTALGEFVDMPGYVTTGKRLHEWIYKYTTRFGLPKKSADLDPSFSRVELDVIYQKSIVSVILQLFLPLMVVMCVVLVAPNLAGSLWDVRIALPSTALLTLVFLQQSYRPELPALPYLSFLDQIYTLCFGASIVIFCLFVWTSNRLDQATEAERPEVVKLINKIDRRFQIGITCFMLIMIAVAWFFPVKQVM